MCVREDRRQAYLEHTLGEVGLCWPGWWSTATAGSLCLALPVSQEKLEILILGSNVPDFKCCQRIQIWLRQESKRERERTLQRPNLIQKKIEMSFQIFKTLQQAKKHIYGLHPAESQHL